MNTRKNIDYSAMFADLDAAVTADFSQVQLYCELGRIVCGRSVYVVVLKRVLRLLLPNTCLNSIRMSLVSPRAIYGGCVIFIGCMVKTKNF